MRGACSRSGPSPRVWGLRWARPRGGTDPRSIPTRVGTTPVTSTATSTCTVHPHACGDYASAAAWSLELAGPSPRVWGLRHYPGKGGARPAVHPHACGDYGFVDRTEGALNGPSPRVWGLPRTDRQLEVRKLVHPHACGDYCCSPSLSGTHIGPSPRVWGLRAWPQWMRRRFGPSPRVWGLQLPRGLGPASPRSIPTRVGTTATRGTATAPNTGPSPRVWGLRGSP